ncbi:MAG: flagellar biosynthetic protein FliO [Melioribacteraceae bacterium]|nr:flagellar biosynthetic protein FliO [Melioribacteraceae bacterium]
MSFLDIIKSLFPLITIILLLFGVLILVRKYSFSLSGKKFQNLHVDILHNQMIIPKKYLSLVRVKDKVFLLGISENNITLIKEFDYDENFENEFDNKELKPNFVDMLKQNLGMK